jgi:3,4-dihydroxy-2-butanone 4-phosphate synthase
MDKRDEIGKNDVQTRAYMVSINLRPYSRQFSTGTNAYKRVATIRSVVLTEINAVINSAIIS